MAARDRASRAESAARRCGQRAVVSVARSIEGTAQSVPFFYRHPSRRMSERCCVNLAQPPFVRGLMRRSSPASFVVPRKRAWIETTVSAMMALAFASSSAAAADNPHKTFTPDAVINPTAYYPEGPQLIDEGLLVAEM